MSSEYDEIVDQTYGNMPQATPLNEYDEEVEAEFGNNRQQLKASTNVASQLDPGKVTEAMRLARKHKMPVSFVEQNLDSFNKHEQDDTDYESLIDEAPRTAKFFEDPYNASVAQKDIEALKKTEKSLGRIRSYKDKPGYATDIYEAGKIGTDNLVASSYHLAAAFGVADIDDVADDIAARNKAVRKAQERAPAYSKEFNQVMQQQGQDVDRAASYFSSSFQKFRERKILEGLKRFSVGGLATVGETADQIGSAVVRPRGAFRATAESFAFSLPALTAGAAGGVIGAKTGGTVGGVAGSVIPGAGTLAGSAIGGTFGGVAGFAGGTFAGSAATEFGAWVNMALEERGYDMTDPEQIKAAYSNKKLMTEIRGEATRKGVTTAGVDALFAAVGGKLVRGVGRGASVGRKALAATADVGVQAVGEGASEFAGQVAARKGDVSKVSLGEAVLEGVVSMGQSAATTAAGASFRATLSKDTVVAAEEVTEATAQAQTSISELQAVEQVMDYVSQTEMLQTNPELLQEFMEKANLEEGQQAVFFQSEQWDEFWRSMGESPVAKMEELLGTGESYDRAKETGQPIEVPLSIFATQYAGKPEMEGLMTITRTQPDGLTVDESRQVLQNVGQTVQELAKEAEQRLEFEEQVDESIKSVRENIEGQLRAVGRDPIEAVPIIEFYRTMAIKEGIDPQEIASRYGLQIGTSADPGAPIKVFNQPEISNAERPAFYSKMSGLIENKMGNKATPEQVLAIIKEAKGDEVKWSGIEQFLEGKTKVDKAELLDFVEQNVLPIETVVLGTADVTRQDEIVEEIKNLENEIASLEESLPEPPGNQVDFLLALSGHKEMPVEFIQYQEETEETRREINDLNDLRIDLQREWRQIEDDNRSGLPKYRDYTLPGGENYREVLFVLPTSESESLKANLNQIELDLEQAEADSNRAAKIKQDRIIELADLSRSERQDMMINPGTDLQHPSPEYREFWKDIRNKIEFAGEGRSSIDLNENQQESVDEVMNSDEYSDEFKKLFMDAVLATKQQTNLGMKAHRLKTKFREVRSGGRDDVYKSSHFDQENALAFTRLKDRVDADGNKVLFVEEIQSDWHQEGRKKGYKNSERFRDLKKQDEQLMAQVNEMKKSGEPESEIDKIRQERADLMDEMNSLNDSVPDAPFRKNWHEFVLKRLIDMAVKGGYDKIAWTTGEQQFDRYGSQLIKWSKNEDGSFNIDYREQVAGQTDFAAIEDQLVRGDAKVKTKGEFRKIVDDVFSRERFQWSADRFKKYVDSRTDKLWDEMQKEPKGRSLPRKEGMEGFYDEILVKTANKYAKKYKSKVVAGEVVAGEVRKTDMFETSAFEGMSEDIEQRFGTSYDRLLEIQEMRDGSWRFVDFNSRKVLKEFDSRGDVESALFTVAQRESEALDNVHTLPITDKMKEKILNEGQEFFQSAQEQTQTDEFKNWFGDSKVVDENGQPLVVYHGTSADFTEFKEVQKKGVPDFSLFGFHVGSSEAANKRLLDIQGPGFGENFTEEGKGRVMPLFVKAENPLRLDENRGGAWGPSDILATISNMDPTGGITQEDIDSINDGSLIHNGENYYDIDEDPAQAREFIKSWLESKGHDSIVYKNEFEGGGDSYILFRPEQLKSASANVGTFDDSGNILEQENRGSITITGNGNFNIQMLANADKSTFFHETGHYFLEVLKDMAGTESASQELKDDFQSILDWLEVESADQIETEHHEKWARGFEAYLREGKAPSSRLRRAFNTFKVWLTQVYRSVLQLNVELTDDVRSVMDRMLATEDEIAAAQQRAGSEPAFLDPVAMGMTPSQAEEYNNLSGEETMLAKEKMMQKLMRAEVRKAKIDREAVRKETTDEINQVRVYNTMSILKRGKMADGSEMPEGSFAIKLDPQEFGARFPQYIRNENFKGTFSDKKPVSLEIAAGILGYDSVDIMINEIANAPNKKEYIDFLTKQKIEQMSDDLLNKEEISEEAEKLIHNEPRSRRLRMEYEFLASNSPRLIRDITKRVTKRPMPDKEVKRYAKQTIDNMAVGSIKPNTYRLAERRSAKEAGEALARQDIRGAFAAKQRELINYELYRAAVEAKDKVKKDNTLIKRIFKKDEKLAKTRDMDLIGAARAILSRYGLGRSTKDPIQHIAKIKEYNPDSYEMIAGIISGVMENPAEYTEVPYGQYRDMIDTVKALWDLAKDAKEIEVGGKKIAITKANEELIADMQKFRKEKPKKKYQETASDWEKMKVNLLGVKAMVRRFEHWVDVMDLGDITGPFRKYLFRETSAATDKFIEDRKKYKEKFIELSKDIRKDIDLSKPIASDELGFQFKNKAELLGALLHTGNESNLRKLLVGRGWALIDEDGNMNTKKWDTFIQRMWDEGVLTKADYDYVQSLWDLMEEIKPMAQRAHKKVFGFYFDEITAQEIETPFGTYRGGYAPAAVDPNEVRDLARKQELEEFIKSHQSYTYPASGGKGFTMSRVENFNKPLSIDLSLVPKHIENVLRFSIIKPAVVDAAKVAMSQDFKTAMSDIDPVVIDELIKPALNRADKNTMQTTSTTTGGRMIAMVSGTLTRNASLQLMFANVVNTAEQVGGFGISATRIAPKYLARSMYRYMLNPMQTARDVREKSTAMRTRTDDQIFEMERQAVRIFEEASNTEKMRDWLTKNAYFMQSFTQNVVDNITWQAAYDETIANGGTDDAAVRKADADVRMTQSSRRPIDISNLETNTTLRFFQMFMNFFNMMANINASNFTKLYYEDIGMKQKFVKGVYLYSVGFAFVAVISAALRKAASGGLDEDEDGEYTDDLFDVFIGSQKDLGLAMIPVAGPAINAGINQSNDKFYDDRVSASPAVSAITAVSGTVSKGFSGKLTDDKNMKGDVRDGLTALGIVTGLPLRPVSKPITYSMDVQSGKAKPKGPVDVLRGVVTGKPGVR